MTKITFETDEADSSRMINLDDILAMLIDKDCLLYTSDAADDR